MAQFRASDETLTRGTNGFSLVELLVVLAIMALLLSMMPTLVSSVRPGTELKSVTRSLENELKRARSIAVNKGTTVAVLFDENRRRYQVSANDLWKDLPDEFRITIETSEVLAFGDNPQISFFDDGSTSGGTVSIFTAEHETSLRVGMNGHVSRQ